MVFVDMLYFVAIGSPRVPQPLVLIPLRHPTLQYLHRTSLFVAHWSSSRYILLTRCHPALISRFALPHPFLQSFFSIAGTESRCCLNLSVGVLEVLNPLLPDSENQETPTSSFHTPLVSTVTPEPLPLPPPPTQSQNRLLLLLLLNLTIDDPHSPLYLLVSSS